MNVKTPLNFGENELQIQRGFCFFFFTLASKGHFRHIINCIAFLSILRLCLGVGLNSVTYMDHLLIFGPSWAQNTILPKEIPYT